MSERNIDLTAIAIAVGEPMADRVLAREAKLLPVAVPGVNETAVYRVLDDMGPHPWQVYVGIAEDGSAKVLTADQDAWAEIMGGGRVSLESAKQALAYVETFLEVTRGAMVIVQPISSLDDLRWRPGSDDEEAAKAAVLADPPDLEPVSERDGDGYHVELALVVDQRIQRNVFDVSSDGRISGTSFKVLAEDLPLPIAR